MLQTKYLSDYVFVINQILKILESVLEEEELVQVKNELALNLETLSHQDCTQNLLQIS